MPETAWVVLIRGSWPLRKNAKKPVTTKSEAAGGFIILCLPVYAAANRLNANKIRNNKGQELGS